MSCDSAKSALSIDLALCSPPIGATLETLLGQIFVLFEQQRQRERPLTQSCAKCSSVKENFRKYKSLTQRKIDGLESQLCAVKEKLTQTQRLGQPKSVVEVLAEDSTLFDTPEKKPVTAEEVPETQLDLSEKNQPIPLVLKYEQPPTKTSQKGATKRRSPVEKLPTQSSSLRREPSWAKFEPQSPRPKKEKVADESFVKHHNPEPNENEPADADITGTRNHNVSTETHLPGSSKAPSKVPECVECQRFFKNLDPSLARAVKRCSKHRHKPEQYVVPSEMWRTKMQDSPELRAAGVCNDTLPCDLKPSKFPKRGFL